MERYFSVNQLTEEKKVKVVTICFEDEALAWYQWEEKRKPMKRWEEVKTQLLWRFRPSQKGSLCSILSLHQSFTVRKYRRWFETLASLLIVISKKVMECNFLNGLKPEIKAEFQLYRPVGLEQIMEMA